MKFNNQREVVTNNYGLRVKHGFSYTKLFIVALLILTIIYTGFTLMQASIRELALKTL